MKINGFFIFNEDKFKRDVYFSTFEEQFEGLKSLFR